MNALHFFAGGTLEALLRAPGGPFRRRDLPRSFFSTIHAGRGVPDRTTKAEALRVVERAAVRNNVNPAKGFKADIGGADRTTRTKGDRNVMAHLGSRFADGIVHGYEKAQEADLHEQIRKIRAEREDDAKRLEKALADAGRLIGKLEAEVAALKKSHAPATNEPDWLRIARKYAPPGSAVQVSRSVVEPGVRR